MSTARARVLVGIVGVVATIALGAAITLPAGAEDGGVITMKPGENRVITSDRVLAGNPALTPTSGDACRDITSPMEPSCDVYRVELDLSEEEGALNFLRLQLDFDTPATPSLAAIATSLVEISAGDLDLKIYDVTKEEPEEVPAGGAGEPYKVPEIAGFEPRSTAYDILVVSGRAPVLGYTLTLQFSDELFDSPFEVIDPALMENFESGEAPVDNSDGSFADLTPPVESGFPQAGMGAPSLTPVVPLPAKIGSDADFNGFRPTIDNQLEGELASFNPNRAAPEIPLGEPPGVASLLFWLLLAPLVVAAAIAFFVRQRRSPALTD